MEEEGEVEDVQKEEEVGFEVEVEVVVDYLVVIEGFGGDEG